MRRATRVDKPNAEANSGSEEVALVRRAQAGDQAALRTLIERWTPRAARLAGRFLTDTADVADVVQEALTAAAMHLNRYDPSRPLWSWLARIIVNRTIDYLRSARARPERPVEDLSVHPASSPPPEAALSAREDAAEVRRVLQTLPEAYRTVLILREMEGMTAEEIGAVVRRPAATVRWRLFQARRLFRDAWLNTESRS